MLPLKAVTVTGDQVLFYVLRGEIVHKVVLPKAVLEDLDRARHRTWEAFCLSFDRHRSMISERVAAALDAGRRGDGNGAVVLGLADFPEA